MATTDQDEFAPILPGAGGSDYERYLRTDELLSLQKGPDEWVHRDELLFQTVHQSSELWLKHAWVEVQEATRLVDARDVAAALRLLRRANEWVHRDELLFQTVHQSSELWLKHAWVEVEEARRLVDAGDVAAALRLLRRANESLEYVIGFLEHLELMSPWEYQEIRRVLGHGSGFDSPGFREIRRVSPGLLEAFHALRRERGLSLVEVYTRGREHEDLYQLAEALTEWDERVGVWRFRHFKVVARIIGEDVVGTQGTPVELLAGLIKYKMFPELWAVRTELTELAKQSD